MRKHTEFPKSDSGDPDTDASFGIDRAPIAPAARYGCLTLWMASASALTVGVMGTVAYGVWLNHDQRAYVDAMASARQALGGADPTSARQDTSWSGQVTPDPAPPTGAQTTPADTQIAQSGAPLGSTASRLAARKTARQTCAVPQVRDRPAPPSKPSNNFLSRFASLFHRGNDQQRGSGIQRDTYAHQ